MKIPLKFVSSNLIALKALFQNKIVCLSHLSHKKFLFTLQNLPQNFPQIGIFDLSAGSKLLPTDSVSLCHWTLHGPFYVKNIMCSVLPSEKLSHNPHWILVGQSNVGVTNTKPFTLIILRILDLAASHRLLEMNYWSFPRIDLVSLVIWQHQIHPFVC